MVEADHAIAMAFAPDGRLFYAEQFTGKPGRYVKLEDTIKDFAELIEGKCDHISEQSFYLVGSLDEARENFEKAGGKAA